MHRIKALVVPVAATGFASAALLGVAVAKSFTLEVANATVSGKQESIVVTGRGFALYELTGDSKHHPECTSAECLMFWPPLKVSSAGGASKSTAVKGKLGVWRHEGFFQVTLGGHPLYRFAGDTHKHTATGQGIMSFGGTWHVIKAGGTGGGNSAQPTISGTTQTTTTSSTPTTCYYPPCS